MERKSGDVRCNDCRRREGNKRGKKREMKEENEVFYGAGRKYES